jgi:hypothetical protein
LKNVIFKFSNQEYIGEGRGVYRGLVGKPEGKRPLGKPRYRWEDTVMMDSCSDRDVMIYL